MEQNIKKSSLIDDDIYEKVLKLENSKGGCPFLRNSIYTLIKIIQIQFRINISNHIMKLKLRILYIFYFKIEEIFQKKILKKKRFN